MASKPLRQVQPAAKSRKRTGAAKAEAPAPAKNAVAALVPSRRELARLHGLVEEQHRRLRVIRSQVVGAGRDAIVHDFPARCPKPHLTRRTLDHLIAESRLRLELEDSTLGSAIRSVWPEARPEVPSLRPSPGLTAYGLRDVPDIPNVVFAVFGQGPGELAAAVEQVAAEQQIGEPFIPVFLTNLTDFTPLREQRLAFEYFPFVVDAGIDTADGAWRAYFVTTLQLSMRRWGVRQIVML